MPPPLITDEVAKNSLILYWLTLATTAVNVVMIAPRAMHIVRASWARKQGTKDEWTSLPNISRWRVVLLCFGALLYFAEAINSLIYFTSLWRYGTADSVTLQIVRLFTVTLGGPLGTVTTTLRISIILATKPVWRVRLIKSVLLVSLVTWAVLEALLVKNLISFLDYDVVQWQSAVMVPPWFAGIVLILTIFCIGGALVSLKLAFSDPSVVMPGTEHNRSSRATLAGRLLGGSTANVAKSASPVDDSRSTLSHPSSTNQRSEPPALPIPKKKHQIVSKGSSADQQILRQSLTISFQVLTVVMTIYWILYILFMVYDNQLLPVKGHAVRTYIACLIFATESLFEPLFHRSKMLARSLNHAGGKQDAQVGEFTVKTVVATQLGS